MLLTRPRVKSRSVPGFDIKDPSLALYLPLWYPHSDMTGSTIYSYDRNRLSCTATGALWNYLNKPGRWFDGAGAADDIIVVGTPAAVNNLAAMTLVAWVNLASAGEGSNGRILDKSSALPTDGWAWFISAVTGNVGFQVKHATTTLSVVVANVYNGIWSTWLHLALTWDGSTAGANVKMYKNGTLLTPDAPTDGVGARANDAALSLSVGNDSTTARTSDGYIGETHIYNRVFTAAEVTRNYQVTKWRYV